MRTDIYDIEQAVRDMMDRVYVDGVAVDYVTQIIESNPPREADAVVLYMGEDERRWDIVAQRFDDAPDCWLSFAILTDEPGMGTIAVECDSYVGAVDYIEIDTRGAADETASLMVESDQLYAGLHGATLDYIERVMLDGKAA